MGAFFQVRGLLRDRKFILSAGLSVAASVLFMSVSIYLLSMDRIHITKIADLSSLDDQTSEENSNNVKPISGIFQLINFDFSSPRADAEISTIKSHIWRGYLTKLDTFCQMSHSYDQRLGVWVGGKFTTFREVGTTANVIVKTDNRLTAGVLNIGPKTCEISKNINSNEQIYVVSDKPFENIESPTYLSIVNIER